MKRSYLIFSLACSAAVIFGAALAVSAQIDSSAATSSDAAVSPARTPIAPIMFPIAELGGCADKNACREYCDDLEHKDACVAFAKEHNLIPAEILARAEKLPKVGPGGCKGENACRAYCADDANTGECVAFAEKHDLIGKEKIKVIKKVVKEGGPGGCKGENACRAYCADPEHADTCIAFAKDNDLLSEKEREMIEKRKEIAEKLREVGGPGGCSGEKECRAYCNDPEHVEECLAFATEHSMMDMKEAERKIKEFIREGEKSIAQISLQKAREYAERMTEQRLGKFKELRELEVKFRAQATTTEGFAGPGGCTSPAECIKFCTNPANRSTCAQFNPSVGGMPPGMIFKEIAPGAASEFRGGTTTEGKFEDLKQCGPRPAMPTPTGCRGPVCDDGRWKFKCGDEDENNDVATSSATSAKRPEVCTQQYEPVCAASGKTYPNECYAKRDGARIVKKGVCAGLETPPAAPSAKLPYPIKNSPILTPEAMKRMMEMKQTMQGDMNMEEGQVSPQSRITPSLFFANIMQGFGGVFR